jgi:hypothetical protein
MSILNFNIVFPGDANTVTPRFGHMQTTDTLAVASAAGYLNPFMASQGISVLPTDIIFCVAKDGTQIYKPVFTGTSVQLTVLP